MVFLKMIKIVYFQLRVFLSHNPTLREIRRGFRGESPGRLHGRGVGASTDESGAYRQRLGAFGPCLPDSQDPADSIPEPTTISTQMQHPTGEQVLAWTEERIS